MDKADDIPLMFQIYHGRILGSRPFLRRCQIDVHAEIITDESEPTLDRLSVCLISQEWLSVMKMSDLLQSSLLSFVALANLRESV